MGKQQPFSGVRQFSFLREKTTTASADVVVCLENGWVACGRCTRRKTKPKRRGSNRKIKAEPKWKKYIEKCLAREKERKKSTRRKAENGGDGETSTEGDTVASAFPFVFPWAPLRSVGKVHGRKRCRPLANAQHGRHASFPAVGTTGKSDIRWLPGFPMLSLGAVRAGADDASPPTLSFPERRTLRVASRRSLRGRS
ncbi:hypothetical protein RUM44_013633 [Polyplax serrata]|uniref:Uncharacterized protein n=1 Tax=Polyplax serrata TaxID=468196 RepID=A0ABR1BEP2_POLSC